VIVKLTEIYDSVVAEGSTAFAEVIAILPEKLKAEIAEDRAGRGARKTG